jgi:RHS repeat-associated protein
MNYRGNPTSVTTYLTPTTPANGITKNFTFDVFGNVLTAQLNCCQTKTWTYSATTNYSQPDSVMRGTSPTQLTSSATYNGYTGQIATSTDENNQVTHYSYDFLHRVTNVTRPDNSQITIGYDDVNFKTTSTSPIDASHSVKQIVAADTLGRPLTTTLQDASNTVYSIVQTEYSLAGRAYGTSNPYTSTAQYWTTSAFDALGRPTTVTLPDNSKPTYSYSTNSVTGTDPAGKQRRSVSDAAGRLSSVYEPDVTNGNSLTLQTSYAYTVLDALATVTQGSQTRTYQFDALGRVQNATIPESNNVQQMSLTYDNFDNVVTRTDARNVVATYTYDGLNRPIGIAYTIPNGSGVSAMPNNICDPTGGTNKTQNVCLYYDQGGAAAYALGRPTKLVDPSGSETYTYNLQGEVTQLSKVVASTTYNTTYAYNLAPELTQVTYPSSRVVQQSYDAIGRLCAVGTSGSTCSTGTTYATGYTYNAAQQLTGFNYGNSVAASFGFSPDRLQLTSVSYAKSGTTLFGLTYSYGVAGSNNGLIASITDTVDNGRSANYSYDGLARLSTAVTTGSSGYPQWGLSWTYDRYANRTDQNQTFGAPPMNHVIVSATTNRITGSPYAYDANGNMTNDGANTLVYDGENHATSATNGGSSGTYTYDGGGLRVKKVSGSTTTVYIFSGSKVIAEYDNGAAPSSPSREYIYSGTTLLAKIDSSGTKYYHRDLLSNRLVTDSSGNTAAQLGHYPYGESWYNASNDKLIFTSYERDSESGNDYAQARYYVNRLGRFSSVDPLSGNSADPQSLNRYSYARNLPAMATDPTGQEPCGLVETKRRRLAEFEWAGMGLLWNELEDILLTEDEPVDWGCTLDGAGGGGGGGYGPPLDPCPAYTVCVESAAPTPPGTDQANPPLENPYYNDPSNSPGVGSVGNLHVLDGSGGDSGGGGSTLDDRANALAKAINKRGVQSLGNPCTVAGFYVASAALGAGGVAAASAPAVVATASQEYPSLINRLLIWAGRFIPRGTIAATVAVIKDAPANIQSACSQLQ